MAIASAAHALGYEPYWMDLNSYGQTTCTKVIGAQNDLYSMGSRLSQKSRLFNRLVWEPMNYEGFRKLTYNAADQKNAELMLRCMRISQRISRSSQRMCGRRRLRFTPE